MSLLKAVVKRVFYPKGSFRRVAFGPYRSLQFRINPQMKTRMSVFYRGYEPEVEAFLVREIREGMVVCNVGAHVGIHALRMAKLLRSTGLVICFEAHPHNFTELAKNVEINGFNNIRLENLAVSVRKGQSYLIKGKGDGMHHLSHNPLPEGSLAVTTTTLDRYFEGEENLPDFILVDVEGKELDVLEGAREIIQKKRPTLVLEHHDRQLLLKRFVAEYSYHWKETERHLFAYQGDATTGGAAGS